MINKIIVFCLIVISQAAQAQQNCLDLFSIKTIRAEITTDFSMSEVKDFSGPNGSLDLFLKAPFRTSPLSVLHMSNLILHKIGGFRDMGVTASTFEYLVGELSKHPSLLVQAKRGDWGAKKRIMRALVVIGPLARYLLNDPTIDLLTAEGFFKIFNVPDHKNFNATLETAQKELTTFMQNPENLKAMNQNIENTTHVRQSDPLVITSEMKAVFDQALIAKDSIVQVLRVEQYADHSDTYIHKLHLSPEVAAPFLEKIKWFKEQKWIDGMHSRRADLSQAVTMIYFFLRAYEARFGADNVSLTQKYKAPWFLNAIRTTDQFDRVYNINEQRLNENLDKALSLNDQVDRLQTDINLGLQTQINLHIVDHQFVEELQQISNEAQKLVVKDLTIEDLSPQFNQLHILQFKLNQLVENLLSTVDNAKISVVEDLNFSWGRVIEGKSYDVKGRDFDHVIFEKDVVSYLKREPMWGDRLLAALLKGYVGTHNQAGLRSVTEIHKDLRYIKVMGRKLRLIGKLTDRTIRFFEVYDKDENFDHAWLHNLIENHK